MNKPQGGGGGAGVGAKEQLQQYRLMGLFFVKWNKKISLSPHYWMVELILRDP